MGWVRILHGHMRIVRGAQSSGTAPVICGGQGLYRGFAQPSPSGPRPLSCGGVGASGLSSRPLRVRARYPAVVRTGTCRQACAGRRHVRPSYHTGGTEITILLALDARGHITVAPTSSGLTA